jgi:hypothetical protein
MNDVDLDWDSIDAMVHEGETEKIAEVEDETKTIEVWLERWSPPVSGPGPEAER